MNSEKKGTIVNCSKCGAEVGEEDLFCPSCGNPITQLPAFAESTVLRPPLQDSLKEAFITLIKPTPPLSRPSYEVQRTLPTYVNVENLIYIAGGLFFVGMVISSLLVFGIGSIWLQYLGFVIAGALSPIILVAWLFKQDRLEPEPVQIPLLLVGWGVMSAAVVLIFHSIIPVFEDAPAWIAGPLPEEPAKIIGVYILVTLTRYRTEFNDHMDGLVWGAAAGAGFAITENFIYILGSLAYHNVSPDIMIPIRNMAAVGHICYTAIVARWLGLMKARYGMIRPVDLVPGLLVAIVIHGIWNSLPSLLLSLFMFAVMVYFLYKYAKEALRDETSWGWSIGHAPVEPKQH